MSNLDSPDPIHRAVMRHSVPEVIQALADGTEIDSRDPEGRTALFYAVKDGDEAVVAELVARGADVDVQDRNKEAPLHFAAREFQIGTASLLIQAGARVDVQDSHGNTPLWRAVFESRGRGEMITLLISAGAKKALKNAHGTSPEDLAKNIGNYDLGGFLGTD